MATITPTRSIHLQVNADGMGRNVVYATRHGVDAQSGWFLSSFQTILSQQAKEIAMSVYEALVDEARARVADRLHEGDARAEIEHVSETVTDDIVGTNCRGAWLAAVIAAKPDMLETYEVKTLMVRAVRHHVQELLTEEFVQAAESKQSAALR
ncbi:hypothetical protein [Devosia sediminis]|uniref:Uncharacterized protein n=1 Tax=Devosia sediminis TaxID=2798801 RepID=A0A934IWG7_9HYPH|nr:hypothetical protein [Devosia sediminis]MBJ3786351.1 hypothetical protein [Devosia sediminis]